MLWREEKQRKRWAHGGLTDKSDASASVHPQTAAQTLNVSVYGKYNGLIRLLTLNLAFLAVFSTHSRGFSKVSGKLNRAHLQQFASICKCLFILFLKVPRSCEGSGDGAAKLICLDKN